MSCVGDGVLGLFGVVSNSPSCFVLGTAEVFASRYPLVIVPALVSNESGLALRCCVLSEGVEVMHGRRMYHGNSLS